MGLVVVLLILGAVLLLLETFLPGMVAGLAGFGCLVAAVVVGYSRFGTSGGTLLMAGVAVGLLVGTLLWMKYFPISPMARWFISERVIGNIDAERPELLDQKGTALTSLRPSGTAIINGQRVDVVSEGPLIEPETPVKVVAVEGIRVVVRPSGSAAASDQNATLNSRTL